MLVVLRLLGRPQLNQGLVDTILPAQTVPLAKRTVRPLPRFGLVVVCLCAQVS